MNIKQIRELAQIIEQSGLTELEIQDGELRIRMAKAPGAQAAIPAPAAPIAQPEAQPIIAAPEPGVDFNRAVEIKSSLIGVFYAASSPDAEPFIRVGSRVKKGDVLCIIEAMKLMNEIVAEQSGEIVDICVGNGDVVEFGQVLFKLC